MEKKYLQDIEHIRSMMERSSRFLSLSGWSGVLAGITALIAAQIAGKILHFEIWNKASNPGLNYDTTTTIQLIILAVTTLIIAVGIGIWQTINKSKRIGLPVWTDSTKLLLIHLLLPLITGGIFALALLYQHHTELISSVMLIFYGIALLSASKFTFNDIAYLGGCEIVLGLTGLFFPGFGLLFWAIGFGLLHIVYGIVMQKKYH